MKQQFFILAVILFMINSKLSANTEKPFFNEYSTVITLKGTEKESNIINLHVTFKETFLIIQFEKTLRDISILFTDEAEQIILDKIDCMTKKEFPICILTYKWPNKYKIKIQYHNAILNATIKNNNL